MEKVIVKLNGVDTTLETVNIVTLSNGDKQYTLTNGSIVTIPKIQINEGTIGKSLLLD